MISVIIPTYNEEENIVKTIGEIKIRDTGNLVAEIIISDGQSTDNTLFGRNVFSLSMFLFFGINLIFLLVENCR